MIQRNLKTLVNECNGRGYAPVRATRLCPLYSNSVIIIYSLQSSVQMW